jgi:hypothetical protein
MGFHKQPRIGRACALSIFALSAAVGCGTATVNDAPQFPQTTNPAFSGGTSASNAESLVVPMSMVLPKKAPPMATVTAPPAPVDMGGFPGAGGPPAGTQPGGAPTVPGAAPGLGAAGAAAPPAAPASTPAVAGQAKGFEISGVPEAELSVLRDTCVSEINRYRATVTTMALQPITRATPEQEECSEKGAKMDGDTMSAHGAARAGICSSLGLGAENTCPGWPVGGGFGGNATIADALKGCLKAMWEEGEPPMGRQACIQDAGGCFQAHGHYLNMSDPNIGSAACSFYKMMDGRSYWMNQDFTSTFSGFGR